MKCPVCKNHKGANISLHTEGFYAGITECDICGTVWSSKQGLQKVVKDGQARSFLEGAPENVEADDYAYN
ncbi:MAG: hypothetical protein WC913_01365 [Desulfuromonas sp.]